MNDKRVDQETGDRCRFHSSILVPWCRRSPQVSEVLPLLYLHGPSTGDFVPAPIRVASSFAAVPLCTSGRGAHSGHR